MNYIKRGFLGITRMKGKSIILLAVIFILGNVISGAISIQQATSNVEASIKERLGAAATLDIDWQAYEQLSEAEMMEVEFGQLDVELIKQIGELSYVKYYDFTTDMWLWSDNIDSYQGDFEEEEGFFYGDDMSFILKGINYAPVVDFQEGRAELADGRVFTQEEVDNGAAVAIISTKLAQKNNLTVGDTFALTNKVFSWDDETGAENLEASRDVVLEIIGIFESSSAKDEIEVGSDGFIDWMDMEYQNTIYVPNAVVLSEMEYQMLEYMKVDEFYAEMVEEEGGNFWEYYIPVYVLNSPEDIEAFEEEVQPLLPEFYTVVSATDHYDSIAGPVESMSKLSKYVLIAAVVATVLIIGLVVLLFLRDRKRELGIYLSLGESRGRVVGQVLIQVMVISVIALTLSLFSGNLLASQISDTMMQADTRDEFYDFYYNPAFQVDLTTEDVLASYEVALDGSYVLAFLGIGLLTILISTVIPLIYIVRLNPKKILM